MSSVQSRKRSSWSLSASILRPIKVNCWFCNSFHVVPRGNRNSWDCPTCDQFNGFDETGDYIKPIPAQHDEYLNVVATTSQLQRSQHGPASASTSRNSSSLGNGFCNNCNRNQHLKITQIAAFVPVLEEHFEEEATAYRRHLDSAYPLCVSCESVLRQKLGSQDASFLPIVRSWRRKEAIRRQAKKELHTTQSHLYLWGWFPSLFNLPMKAQLLRLFSIMVITILILATSKSSLSRWSRQFFRNQDLPFFSVPINWIDQLDPHHHDLIKNHYQLLTLIGFFFLIISIFVSGIKKLRLIDAINCFTWLALLFSHSKLVTGFFSDPWFHFQVVQFLFSFVCLAITLYGLLCNRSSDYSTIAYRRYNRLNSSSNDILSDSPLMSLLYDDFEASTLSSSDGSASDVIQDGLVTTTTLTINGSKDANFKLDLDNGLQALKIGTPKKSPNSASGGIFTPRSYDQRPSQPPTFTKVSTTAMFSVDNHVDHQQNMIDFQLQWRRRRSSGLIKKAPTHSSWVSGGYFSKTSRSFGGLIDARSPSLRTGIAAVKSYSCPVSRAGSVLCDDRLSVISDPGRDGRVNANGGRPFLLSKCKFNPFRSNYINCTANYASGYPKDFGNSLGVDQKHSSLSSSPNDNNEENHDKLHNINDGDSFLHPDSMKDLSGPWKRASLYALLLASLIFNALFLFRLLS